MLIRPYLMILNVLNVNRRGIKIFGLELRLVSVYQIKQDDSLY